MAFVGLFLSQVPGFDVLIGHIVMSGFGLVTYWPIMLLFLFIGLYPLVVVRIPSGVHALMTKHGRYQGISGWFDINGTTPSAGPTVVNAVNANGTGLGGKDAAVHLSDQAAAANSLCALGAANGVTCSVVMQPGKHDWPFADRAFAAALPWLAGQVGTPGVPRLSLPGAAPLASHVQ